MALVLPVGCGFVGLPVLHLRVGPVGILPPLFLASKIQCCTGTRSGASNRDGTPAGFVTSEFYGGPHPASLSPLVRRVLAAPVDVVADPPPLACVWALASNFGKVFFYGGFALLLAWMICITLLATP